MGTSVDYCWGISCFSHLVVVMDTRRCNGTEYAVTEILQMIGKANRPFVDENSFGLLICENNRKQYYKSCLLEPFPIESQLNQHLHDHFNAEIVTEIIEGKQEAIDYLTWTFYYRRLSLNPNYYNLTGSSHRYMSNHLSELVEATLEVLVQSGCIIIEDNNLDVKPTNIGRIAAYHYVSYKTIEVYKVMLQNKTKHKGILDMLCNSVDFDTIKVRLNEEILIKKILSHARMQIETPKYDILYLKVNALLQSHFSRNAYSLLNEELLFDQSEVVLMASRLTLVLFDIIASEGWIDPLLATAEISQMLVQALWISDSPLLQLPYFSETFIENCSKVKEINSVYDILDLQDEDRKELFKEFSDKQIAEVAKACNRYPDIQLRTSLTNPIKKGEPVFVNIILERDWNENEQGLISPVYAPHYPIEKNLEGWWIIGVSNNKTNLLFARKVDLEVKSELRVQFFASLEEGTHKFKLYLICDSYIGCDQEHVVEYAVKNLIK